MKKSKKDFSIAGQSTTKAKKSQKHDANLQKNSTLYFQIGLILCLLCTYALFEMQFQEKKIVIAQTEQDEPAIAIDYVKPYVVEVIKPKETKPFKSKDLIDVYEEVIDDRPIIETVVNTPDAPEATTESSIEGIPEIDTEVLKGPIVVDINNIQKVPIYPGCEKYTTNEKRKKCMSDKISKLVSRKFNVDIGSEHGISGRQRIYTQFTIDKKGNVTDIKIRGPHSALEREAERVINKIPKMEPGLQQNEPVGVKYTLPIVFDVKN